MTKEELMTRVWPGLVVEENNIQVHVSALRKVLARDTSGSVHLVTVASRGYRLLGVDAGAAAATSVVGAPPRPGPTLAVLPFRSW